MLLTAAVVLICTPLSSNNISALGFSFEFKKENSWAFEMKCEQTKRIIKRLFFNVYIFEKNEIELRIIARQN